VLRDRYLRAEIIVTGIVQGVGFRPFIYRIALQNNLVGYVRNRGDAGVEITVQGTKSAVKQFLIDLKKKKPSLSQIYDLTINYTQEKNTFIKFEIIQSFQGGSLSGSVIPYDVSVCSKCLEELRDLQNRRKAYFFITCTECGPRYSTIERLPYDRLNTTMQNFPMCEKCKAEYVNPLNRRFHAQTIACKQCGPQVFLTENDGNRLTTVTPIRDAGKFIEEGYIVAVKGNGGFHIATSTTNPEPILRLRKIKHRNQKPFAIMARDIESVLSFAEMNDIETQLLTSSSRPIVLLKKSINYYLSKNIAPKLHNIGVMLPYTGLHYMLFDHVKEPAFVMTSANAPSDPIVTNNQEALVKLGDIVDFFLFHDRNIAQRCDDSLIRVHKEDISFIRRSRGYVPTPIRISIFKHHSTLGVGAEENVNSCILLGNKAFVSQYIGDVEQLETLQFLKNATKHLLNLTQSKIEAVACDMHPRFITTKLAQEVGRDFNCPVIPVQHHYAHILSLMGERGIKELIGIACDGTGYGLHGDSWGGEILHCTLKEFNRLGHLQQQPLIGGDLAAKYPLRMTIGSLHQSLDISEWIFSKANYFPYGDTEVNIILTQIKKDQMPMTSSCGRVLDAISALLDLCYERTYEGEPAMKLESTAIGGKDVLQLDAKINSDIIDTTYLVREIFENRHKHTIPDLAYSAEAYIAKSLAKLSIEKARELDVNTIGFSGGVAYNKHITLSLRKHVETNGLNFLVHNQIPPGDGGISFGQAIAASNILIK
jgi:hydrogenase maturation protein HypF